MVAHVGERGLETSQMQRKRLLHFCDDAMRLVRYQVLYYGIVEWYEDIHFLRSYRRDSQSSMTVLLTLVVWVDSV